MRAYLPALLVVIALVCNFAFSEEVIKAAKGAIGISHPPNEKWKVGDQACISRMDMEVACGTVTRVSGSWAVLKIGTASDTIEVGDSVNRPLDGSMPDNNLENQANAPALQGAYQGKRPGGRTRLYVPSSYGIRLGVNLSTLKTNPEPAIPFNKDRLGFVVSIFADLPIANFFFFSPEIGYTQKGVGMSAGGAVVTTQLDYVEAGLLFKLKFGGQMFRVVIPFGVAGGYLTNAKAVVTVDNQSVDTGIGDSVFKSDIAAKAGLGFELTIGTGESFFLEGRYAPGLTKINTSTEGTVKHLGIEVTAGLSFVL